MKTTILKALSLILLITSFGKMNAQSDLLAFNAGTSATASSEEIAKFNAEQKVKISDFMPNPSSSSSLINVNCSIPVSMKVKFFTMNGDLAREASYNLEKGVNELNIDMLGLEKGIYMVQFYSTEGSAVRRFMKG